MKVNNYKIISKYRKKGFSYQKIADILGCSKQRIHQIYKNYKSFVRDKLFLEFINLNPKCLSCGSMDNLQVHHRDGNRKNNNFENLKRLCRSCHYKEESELYRNALKNTERNRGSFVKCVQCKNLYWRIPARSKVAKFCSKKCSGLKRRKFYKLNGKILSPREYWSKMNWQLKYKEKYKNDADYREYKQLCMRKYMASSKGRATTKRYYESLKSK